MVEFSFIVPVYKVPYDMLHNCINSILNQTYKNIELILVDDGSPDECGAICDSYAEKDSRVKVVHKPNGGLSDARNAGTDTATSMWLTYVDGDDWVDDDFAESFLKHVESCDIPADMYLYSGYRNYAFKEVKCTPYFAENTVFMTYEERELLQKECCLVPTRNNGDQLFIGSGWAKVYNISYLKEKKLYFPIIPYAEDSIFFLYSVEEASRVEYIPKAVYHYRDTEGGMVHGFRKNADIEHNIYCEKLFEFAEQYNKSKAFVDVLYYRVFIAMQRCLTQKYYNNGNSNGPLKRWVECQRFMTSKPYCDVYKHISYSRLNRNSKIKFILFKMRLYGVISHAGHSYKRKTGKTMQSTNRHF